MLNKRINDVKQWKFTLNFQGDFRRTLHIVAYDICSMYVMQLNPILKSDTGYQESEPHWEKKKKHPAIYFRHWD